MPVVVSVSPWNMDAATEVERAAVIALVRASMVAKKPSEHRSAVRTRKLLQEWFSIARTGALIARGKGNETLGFVVLRNEPPALRIVYICARYSRNRVGSVLIRRLDRLASQHRLSELRATINPEDETQSQFFLQHLGFEIERPAEVVEGVKHYDTVRPVAAVDESQEEPSSSHDILRAVAPSSVRDELAATGEADPDLVDTGSHELSEDPTEVFSGAAATGESQASMEAFDEPGPSSPPDPEPEPEPEPEPLPEPEPPAPAAPGARGAPSSPPAKRRLVRAHARAVVIAGETKRRISLGSKNIYVVGRHPAADIVVEGKKASRKHCELRWKGERLFVEDLGSANGTFLNGKLISIAEICEGDVISVGRTRVGFDNLAVRSQPVEVAGKIESGEDPSDTHFFMRRRRARTQQEVAPPYGDDASPEELREVISALQRTLEAQSARLHALEGVLEAAKSATMAAQQELIDERRRRKRIERDLRSERAAREELDARMRAALENAGGAGALKESLSQARTAMLDLEAFVDALADADEEDEQPERATSGEHPDIADLFSR